MVWLESEVTEFASGIDFVLPHKSRLSPCKRTLSVGGLFLANGGNMGVGCPPPPPSLTAVLDILLTPNFDEALHNDLAAIILT